MKIPGAFVRRRARIEIIPLIDIIFFLLATFVMVSMSMIKNQGVSVNLPTAATGAPEDRNKSVTVSVTEDGHLYLNKELVQMEDLRSRLKVMINEEPDLKVFVNGDDGADFGVAVGILDEIRALGIKKVAIQTRAKK